MSAIAGVWRFDGKPEPQVDCALMLAAQGIYGPHDGRHWCDGSLSLGRRLFRTLPEDVHDRQPVHSSDKRLTLVADVRLDNRSELVAALDLNAEHARRLCDADILLAGLEHWGEGALDRLVGDFAFALWDAYAQRLLLARDFLGQRPLHYHAGKGFFAFASMPKGLHALAEVPYGADEQAVAEFVVLMPQSGPRSFFKDIHRVEAGHVVTVSRDGMSMRRYWNPRPAGATRVRADDCAEGLRHHLDQATRSRLRGAEAGVGAQLSAGVDSAAVAATAARLLAPSGGRVVAFTGVPREGYDLPCPAGRLGDEGPLAAATAAMYPNIEHVLIRADDRSPLADLDRLFFLFGRPMLNLCNSGWVCAINQAARERKLGVLLNGQMGNFSLSYNGVELLPELLRAGRLLALGREAAKLIARRRMRWDSVLAKTFGPFMPVWLWQWTRERVRGSGNDILTYTAIRRERLAELDLPALAAARDLDFSYRPRKDAFAARLWALRRIDFGEVSKGSLAGWGVDQRDPTADRRLIEYCLGLPTEQYLANGVTRALARRALADRVPPAVLKERRKGYQGIDWHEGLTAARADVATELDRLGACEPAARTLDLARLRRLVESWPTTGWERDDVMQPYRLALLRGISAGHFARKAAGSNQ